MNSPVMSKELVEHDPIGFPKVEQAEIEVYPPARVVVKKAPKRTPKP